MVCGDARLPGGDAKALVRAIPFVTSFGIAAR
jgi:hypothetical protein